MARGAQMVVWAGGEHPFKYGIAEMRAIEGATDHGIFLIHRLMAAGEGRLDWVLAVLRYGLIGGGMTESNAKRTVRDAWDMGNPYELLGTAVQSLSLFLTWNDEKTPVGEAPPADPQAEGDQSETPSPTNGHGGPSTTPPDSSSASADPPPSTN